MPRPLLLRRMAQAHPTATTPSSRLGLPFFNAANRQSYFLLLKSARASSNTTWNEALSSVLDKFEGGYVTAEDAKKLLLRTPPESQCPDDEALESFANLDYGRATRTGFPEAVFSEGKTAKQIVAILDNMAGHVNERVASGEGSMTRAENSILATRVDRDLYEEIAALPLRNGTIVYHEMARIINMKASAFDSVNDISSEQADSGRGRRVVVACAGTTDLPVAEEAAVTLEASGIEVDRVYDVGVAGLHRIINALPRLRHPDVRSVIVCAGMDGALPSVVGGLVSVPVVAVPTSVGYGASFGGVSALLTMLNSCAPGVGVVNVDNGFGAAALVFKCVNS